MQRMSKYIVRFGHSVRSFLSPGMYKSVSTKIIVISGSMFRALSHFLNASTDDVHMTRLSFWVHWYRCCIVSGANTQRGWRLVVACPHRCMIVMVAKVLLIHFVVKFAMWTVVASRARLNYLRSIASQSSMWVKFWSSQYLGNRRLEILYTIEWERLEWTGTLWMDTLGSL